MYQTISVSPTRKKNRKSVFNLFNPVKRFSILFYSFQFRRMLMYQLLSSISSVIHTYWFACETTHLSHNVFTFHLCEKLSNRLYLFFIAFVDFFLFMFISCICKIFSRWNMFKFHQYYASSWELFGKFDWFWFQSGISVWFKYMHIKVYRSI